MAASRRCMAFPRECVYDAATLLAIYCRDKPRRSVVSGCKLSRILAIVTPLPPPLHPFPLLQAANHRRHRRIRETRVPVGDANFTDIDVAFRVQRDAVRREEFAGLEAGAVFAAEPRDALSF